MATPEGAVNTVEDVRRLVGEPSPVSHFKVLTALDATAIAYIRRCPFLLLATSDAEGRPDVSPKGDEPGFVSVEDEHTLLIPERKGNRLIFSLQNILANPRVGLLFMVPGTEETLRVQGQAELTEEAAVRERLSARGQAALLAIRVSVDRCFVHCARAFRRSRLWDTTTWPPVEPFSFGEVIASRMGAGEEVAREIDRRVEDGYTKDL